MANEVIGIDYSKARDEISLIREGISNLHTNFEHIYKATNDIVNNSWKGKDAEAYKDKVDSFTKTLERQTEGLTRLVDILDRQIEEDIAHERDRAGEIS
jgi:hypothetical protein